MSERGCTRGRNGLRRMCEAVYQPRMSGRKMQLVMKHLMGLLLFFCVFLTIANGQGPGVLKGTVEDSSGAPIAGAEVKLRNTTTNEELHTTCDEDGYFEFKKLSLGTYLVAVEAEGFEMANRPVEVSATSAHAIRIRLKLAQMKQQVTVTAKTPPSAQENTDFVQLDQHWLQNLPVKEGDPLAIPSLFLDPAATGTEGPKIIVDGVESSTLEIPMSSIKAVYVNKSPYSAEFGRPGKGRIEVITKKGSHQHYRGTLLLLLRNSAVDARNAFATTRPPLQRAVSEAQLSGPLGKSLTFLIAGRYFINNNSAVIKAETPTGLLTENFNTPERSTHLFGRLDFGLSARQKLTISYKYKDKARRNQGVGGFNLPERATDIRDHENEVRIFETATVSDNFLNEARFTLKEQTQHTNSLTNLPAIIVLDAFSAGGAQISQRRRETVANIQDIAMLVKGRHSLRFGGGVRPRFFFSSDSSNFGGTFSFSSLATFAAKSPFLFTINQGNPRVFYQQHEFFTFFQDEIRLRSDLSLSLGLRHEMQSNLNDYHNFAPRLALAYAPGSQQTVIRAGAGVFYDREPEIMQQQALLFDGLRIRQIVISNPGFPLPFDPSTAASFAVPSVVRIARGIRAPYLIQASVGVERKLGKGRNYLAVDYTRLRGVRLYRMRNINAPLPGTDVPPDPNFININQFESSASSRSNRLTVTFQVALRRSVDVLAQYTLSRALNDTGGLFSLPANNYDLRGEWGRADFDQRHRFNLVGVYRLPFGFKAGSVVNLNSEIPFNITTGFDNNHDTVANDRPPGVGRNTGQGPGFANMDLHLSKEIRLRPNRPRPKFEVGLDGFNVFNHVNFQNFVGTVTSRFFGRANAAKPARELQLSLKFDF